MASSSSLTINLRLDPVLKKVSLQDQVLQIFAQRGTFRDLSEAKLRDEIEHPTRSDYVVVNENDKSDELSDDEGIAETREENLFKSRDEFMQKLNSAQNDVLSALDFVSLLLSNHSAAAQSTMSTALKELVPAKTLDGRFVQSNDLSDKTKERRQQVSEGWKSNAFGETSSRLGAACTRLEDESQKQGQYWEQIAHLKTKGWPISRLPNDSRAIGVHFGSPEATPHLRGKGFALLHQDDSGSLILDSRFVQENTAKVHVTILRQGRETGCSGINLGAEARSSDIHAQLNKARDALFEEELFYEIYREARAISNQGVQTRLDTIEADIGESLQIRLERSSTYKSASIDATREDNNLAEVVGLSLRMLLVTEHKRSYQRRTLPPAPMTLVPPPVPERAILRPLLTRLRHESRVAEAQQLCEAFSQSLGACGIATQVEVSSHNEGEQNELDTSFVSLRGRMASRLDLSYDKMPVFSLQVETYLAAPIYGTRYAVTKSTGSAQTESSSSSWMHSLREVVVVASDILLLFVTSRILAWMSTKSEPASDGADNTLWLSTKPHAGEFAITKGTMAYARAILRVQPQRVTLHVMKLDRSDRGENEWEQKSRKQVFTWNASNPNEASRTHDKRLEEVVTALGLDH